MSDEKSASQVADELVQEAYNKFQDENYTAALQLCQAALAIYEGIGDRVGVAYTLTNIGNIYRKQAVESYQEALSTFRENSIQISEEIARVLSFPLESKTSWYASYRGKIVKLPVPSKQIDIPPKNTRPRADGPDDGPDDFQLDPPLLDGPDDHPID